MNMPAQKEAMLQMGSIIEVDTKPMIALDFDPDAFVRQLGPKNAEVTLRVTGAHCQGCMAKIERGLMAESGVLSARLALTDGQVRIGFDPTEQSATALAQTLLDLGYGVKSFDVAEIGNDQAKAGRALLLRFGVACFAAMNIMMFSVPVWATLFGADMDAATRTLFHWLSGLIALPVAVYAGQPFFTSAFAALKKGRANMDVPISLAIILASGLSVYETVTGGTHAYFDAVVMLLAFLLLGRWLDHRLRQKAAAAAHQLLASQATSVTVKSICGTTKSVRVKDLVPADMVLLPLGAKVPADGYLEDDFAIFDQALLSGENAPVEKQKGDLVHAGSINLGGPITLKIAVRADQSLVADLARLIETGAQSKSKPVLLAQKAVSFYVPAVHSAAFLTGLFWYLSGAGFHTAITNACAVLIITCPCALALAVPAVQIVATGRLFKSGILVKSGDALENLSNVDTAIFDKTGILTDAHLVPDLADFSAKELAICLGLAQHTSHPLSRALVRFGKENGLNFAQDISAISETMGQGVSGKINGIVWRLGSARFVGATAGAGTEIWLKAQDEAAKSLSFSDTIAVSAQNMLSYFDEQHIGTNLLSGDRPEIVADIASQLNIKTALGGQSPKDKLAFLNTLSQDGKKTLMVGDGLNDAAGLAAANVSMAPASAADVSQTAADIVLMGNDLAQVAFAHKMAKMAQRRVKENFALSIIYNGLAAPLAMAGFVTPLIAAIAMSGSSLLVMLNALRLQNVKA